MEFKNQTPEECGCYRLIQCLVIIQQMVCIYLIQNYPLAGSTKTAKLFIHLSTLLFSSTGLVGVLGAYAYDDRVLTAFILILLTYAILQVIICTNLVKTEPTISDFHCVLFIVATLMAALTFTTLTTRHTFSEYRHSDQVWNWMSE